MPTLALGLFPTESPQRIVELTKLAEDLGYSSVYIGDSQMIWREAYVILGAAATADRGAARIRASSPPTPRIPRLP